MNLNSFTMNYPPLCCMDFNCNRERKRIQCAKNPFSFVHFICGFCHNKPESFSWMNEWIIWVFECKEHTFFTHSRSFLSVCVWNLFFLFLSVFLLLSYTLSLSLFPSLFLSESKYFSIFRHRYRSCFFYFAEKSLSFLVLLTFLCVSFLLFTELEICQSQL